MRKTCLDSVFKLAKTNKKIIFIGSDLGPGTLEEMRNQMPDRFFMEGISEQHIIGMSAGLALSGFIPYVNTIAPFLTRRCYEQILVDVCLQNLPVRLIGNGGGVVYAPLGPTHLAMEDIAILRVLPNMTILAPCDAVEMELIMNETVTWPGPLYIRLAKGGDEIITNKSEVRKIGKGVEIKPIGKHNFISTGVMTQLTLDAHKILLDDYDINVGIIHLHTISPLDRDLISKTLTEAENIITVEEHYRTGGLGTSILEFCNDNHPEHSHKISRIGIPDEFPKNYGSQQQLIEGWGITAISLSKLMLAKIKNESVS